MCVLKKSVPKSIIISPLIVVCDLYIKLYRGDVLRLNQHNALMGMCFEFKFLLIVTDGAAVNRSAVRTFSSNPLILTIKS